MNNKRENQLLNEAYGSMYKEEETDSMLDPALDEAANQQIALVTQRYGKAEADIMNLGWSQGEDFINSKVYGGANIYTTYTPGDPNSIKHEWADGEHVQPQGRIRESVVEEDSEAFIEDNPTISASHAQSIVKSHNSDWSELTNDLGNKHQYKSAEVLGWLGY